MKESIRINVFPLTGGGYSVEIQLPEREKKLVPATKRPLDEEVKHWLDCEKEEPVNPVDDEDEGLIYDNLD
ncbi:MAG: hypothetical protein ACOX1S_07205 [Anaerostipes sp.]|nr:hypothetical protein [Lachnospira sp.]